MGAFQFKTSGLRLVKASFIDQSAIPISNRIITTEAKINHKLKKKNVVSHMNCKFRS